MHTLAQKVQFYRDVAIQNGSIKTYYNRVASDIELLADSIYHSARIEGNTISYADTLALLRSAIPITEAFHKYSMKETFELSGLKTATEYMYNSVGIPLTITFIDRMHMLLYKGVEDLSRGIYAGEIRTYPSFTRRSDNGEIKHYMEPRKIQQSLEDMVFQYFYSNKTLSDICLLKLDFIHIHPYGDGNGRVSRLLLNWALMSNGYPPIIIKEQDRARYIQTLNIYGDTGNDLPFIDLVSEYLLEIYKEIL